MAQNQLNVAGMSEVQAVVIEAAETQVVAAVPGIQGPLGPGVASGGTTGQSLIKASNGDYDTAWATVSGITNLSYSGDTRTINSSTGSGATLPIFASGIAGLVPSASGGTTLFLREDGEWFAAGAPVAGASGWIQYNNGASPSGLAASSGLVWDDSASKLEVGGDLELNDGGTYTTTVQVVTPTANRAISFPDATGTVALVPGSSGEAIYNNGGALAGISTMTFDGTSVTLAGRLINSYSSLASAPAKVFTGAWFTGGTSTTTKPHLLIEPTGTTSTAWSTSGTGLGVNAASGFSGRLLDLQINGTSQMLVQWDGKVGIRTTSPYSGLDIGFETMTLHGGLLDFRSNDNASRYMYIGCNANDGQLLANVTNLKIGGSSNTIFESPSTGERARIDSSGRLLVGTSTARTNFYNTTASAALQIEGQGGTGDSRRVAIISSDNTATAGGGLLLAHQRSGAVGGNTVVQSGDNIGAVTFQGSDGTDFVEAASIIAQVDGTPGANDMPGRLVFSTTADGQPSPTERLRINNSGAIGLSGANFGTAGQVLVSNGSSAAPTWEQITPSAVFGWDHDNDTYGLYLSGTSIRTGALSGTVDIDVQSRLRRCVINDSGVVQYYLDADDSTLKSGDWLRIVETQALNTTYTGTHSESTNSLLRVGVPAWAANTFTRGQRVTHNGSLWECVAASTTATPAAGTVASDLSGTDGQVMVEVPAFSVRYGYINGVHTREVRLGCNDSLIAQGFQPHPAFIKTDGTYKDAFYIGAYQVTGTSPATTVSGANNRVSMTRATQRSASAARGTGWHVLSYLELAAIQTLMVTEFRDMNTQRAIGNGAQEGAVYVVNTGLSNAAGNRSQNAYTSGGAVTDYISYRGLENIYGRAWQWVDGFNVYERVVYLSNDQTAFADNTSVGYEFYAQVPSGSSSYQKELFALSDVFLPSVVTGASATTYLGDAFWTSTGWRVAYVGGGSGNGARVGAFALGLNGVSGVAYSDISARLAYAAN